MTDPISCWETLGSTLVAKVAALLGTVFSGQHKHSRANEQLMPGARCGVTWWPQEMSAGPYGQCPHCSLTRKIWSAGSRNLIPTIHHFRDEVFQIQYLTINYAMLFAITYHDSLLWYLVHKYVEVALWCMVCRYWRDGYRWPLHCWWFILQL